MRRTAALVIFGSSLVACDADHTPPGLEVAVETSAPAATSVDTAPQTVATTALATTAELVTTTLPTTSTELPADPCFTVIEPDRTLFYYSQQLRDQSRTDADPANDYLDAAAAQQFLMQRNGITDPNFIRAGDKLLGVCNLTPSP